MHGSGLQSGASSGPCGEDGAVHTGSDRGQNGDTAESGLTQLTATETVYSSGPAKHEQEKYRHKSEDK